MKKFECYRCGLVIESEKRKQECPSCGRKMSEQPIDRKKLLIEEIVETIEKAKFEKIKMDYFPAFNLLLKETNFPTYNEIYFAASKSESSRVYFKYVEEAVNNLLVFNINNGTFRKKADSKQLINHLKKSDVYFGKVTKTVGVEIKPNKLNLEFEFLFKYEKKKELIPQILKMVDLAKALIDKMKHHVKTFGIYGNVFCNSQNVFFESKDISLVINTVIDYAESTISKKIPFDFFNDGIEDFEKMERCLWNLIFVLRNMCKPTENRYFEFSDRLLTIEQFNEYIASRYLPIDLIVKSPSFLNSLEVKEILEIYDKNQDIFGDGSSGVDLTGGGSMESLNKLIGLNGIKESIKKIIAYVNVNKGNQDINTHMCFLGNPGTGKTEVARIIANILYENKILPSNKLIETDRAGLIGQYVGETPQKVMGVIRKAMGGVLFIDEAYSLVTDESGIDYGHEAVATLIKAMEDYRGKFCVILAGYKNPMNKMMATNPGFKSRIQFMLDFPNYSRDELSQIVNLMINKRKYTLGDDSLEKILDVLDVLRKDENFANAREVRNILDQVIMNQNLRCNNPNDKELSLRDVNKYIKDNKLNLPTSSSKGNTKILSAEEELDELIGLDSIKKTIKKIKAYAKRNKENQNFNMHMCFYGNPGTGKTEVARIVSRLLCDAKVLEEAKLVETDRTGLVGKYIGETGIKTKEKIESALNGVLFIDEAYLLSGTSEGDYGKEAIATLLKEMEDKRGQFCVILAGYRKEMQEMLSINPGFKSRIQFELDFPDYSKEELKQIANKFINKQNYQVTDEALDRIVEVAEYYKNLPDFANARTIRNIIDQVIMNQSLRVEDEIDNYEIIIDDVNDYIDEQGIKLERKTADTPVVNVPNLEFVKNEVAMLPMQYSYFNTGMINPDYINEAVISISGNNSEGTGFIISPMGLCLTCEHCIINNGVNQMARVMIRTYDGQLFKNYVKFSVISLDKENDLALIKLDSAGFIYKFLPLMNNGFDYKPFSEFYVGGYPFGGESFDQISFTEGKVASINNYNGRKVIFADMFGQPGSSGSPIIDKSTNKVIGVFFGGISKGDVNMIKCFTPIDVIWNFVNGIIK